MNEIPRGSGAMSFEDFRRSFYYGTRADVQPEHQLGVSVSRKRSARG